MKKHLLEAALVTSVLVGSGLSSAYAVSSSELMLSDNGVSWTTVATPATGVVNYSGTLGTTWSVIIATGTTKPALTGPADMIDLNSVQVSSTGGGTLYLRFYDSGFNIPGAMETQIGGTVGGGGTLQAWSWLSPGNNVFDPGLPGDAVVLANLGPFSAGAFSATANSGYLPSGSYSLALGAKIYHAGSTVTSFNEHVGTVPDGGVTVALLGLALAGLAGVRRLF